MEMFSSRISTIRRHVAPSFLNAKQLIADVDAVERLGIRIESNVRRALLEGLPVVALESTIISHGMPYPENLQTAKVVEAVVKQNGATPATIAILAGVPCIGLSDRELENLAQCGTDAVKTSRRDIATVIAKGATGATTVSATMFFAAKAGIRVFVTGGIGGVHQQGESTLDVSCDLTELGRTPVAVVCAGVKSILDIPRTLEYLETHGVTVVGYGTGDFPAFFSPKSGCKVPCRADTVEECAIIIGTNLKLDLQSGILIGVPIPQQHAAAAEVVEKAIQLALEESRGCIIGFKYPPPKSLCLECHLPFARASGLRFQFSEDCERKESHILFHALGFLSLVLLALGLEVVYTHRFWGFVADLWQVP